MHGPKWDVGGNSCPKCSRRDLIYDGSIKWRHGPRPPRNFATKRKFRTSSQADFEIAHYFLCTHCSTRFFDPVDGQTATLNVEIIEDERAYEPNPGWTTGSIGDINSRFGYDVRDLWMAGYSDKEIHQVLYGHRTLDDLLNCKPRRKA